MVVPLLRVLSDDPVLLQQVVHDPTPHHVAGLGEVEPHKLAKATGVIVVHGLGIAKRLKNGTAGCKVQSAKCNQYRSRNIQV